MRWTRQPRNDLDLGQELTTPTAVMLVRVNGAFRRIRFLGRASLVFNDTLKTRPPDLE